MRTVLLSPAQDSNPSNNIVNGLNHIYGSVNHLRSSIEPFTESEFITSLIGIGRKYSIDKENAELIAHDTMTQQYEKGYFSLVNGSLNVFFLEPQKLKNNEEIARKKAEKKGKTYESKPYNLKGYLETIKHNACKQYKRVATKSYTSDLDGDFYMLSTKDLNQEDKMMIQEFMASLLPNKVVTKRQHQILSLRIEGYKNEEIAEMLQMNPITVRTDISKSKKRIIERILENM
ncbi:MAG: sigma-70 family RNA polymerase sigma factor [Saprospiraceae bacterium]|nr:sigma-70 family RNA polymerase sigma factor [Saprospiraceae bacterium]